MELLDIAIQRLFGQLVVAVFRCEYVAIAFIGNQPANDLFDLLRFFYALPCVADPLSIVTLVSKWPVAAS